MPKKVKQKHRKDCAVTPAAPLTAEREARLDVRLTDMVSETTCRLNGVLAAVIGLRECPTDQMFGGGIQLIEDLVAHARRVEEAAYEQSWLARATHERTPPGNP